ncbi:hypothetical protein H2200_013253 [Cladophialophora chaetospira]|uniref:Heterokaryon incompatibility domain-containing protein n=1 Tax=Cladophialophora chaetospira TaxID=386627 RepID=A0AA38TXL6_9EURO|nr:hypothetical protein H2200_013253 [Cladophialophora chaetospira]
MPEPHMSDSRSLPVSDTTLESSFEHHEFTEDRVSTGSKDHVRLASFISCCCNAAKCAQVHLAITITDISLSASKHRALAISYAWGAFDRVDHPIGHQVGKPSETIWMQLGGEWSVDSLGKRLVKLTADGNLCWIDQFCVPQKDEQIRRTLSVIPTIFRTLPVIALLPGSICKCLRVAYEDYRRAPDTDSSFRLNKAVLGAECINSNGSCGWTSRIWPLQELRYSRSVQALWADEEPAECHGIGADTDAFEDSKAPGLARSVYRKVGNVNQSQVNIAVRAIRTKNRRFLLDLLGSVTLAARSPLFPKPYSDVPCWMAEFLLGTRMPLDQAEQSLLKFDAYNALTLRNACASLANTSRQATDPRDFVLSVWISWPFYNIPINFRQMSAWEMFADAIEQFQAEGSSQSRQRVILTRCPGGLLREYSLGSATWDITKRLHCENINGSHNLYSLFDWLSFPFATTKGIPVKLIGERSPSRASDIESFERWAEGLDLPSIAQNFSRCVDEWDISHLMGSISETSLSYFAPRLAELVDEGGVLLLIWDKLCRSRNRTGSGDIILRFVCEALQLDFEVCKRNDVGLMFARRSVALKSGLESTSAKSCEITCVGVVNWQKLRSAKEQERQVISVALPRAGAPDNKGPFYEVAHVAGDSPQYTVIGVWLTLRHEVIAGGPEAYIPESWEPEDVDGWII